MIINMIIRFLSILHSQIYNKNLIIFHVEYMIILRIFSHISILWVLSHQIHFIKFIRKFTIILIKILMNMLNLSLI